MFGTFLWFGFYVFSLRNILYCNPTNTILLEMEGLMHLVILEELREELLRHENIARLRQLRDASNPFDIPDDVFLKTYRFDKQSTRNIVEMLRPHLINTSRITAVPTEIKVLTLLYFVGHGSYQKCVGLNVNLCLEQSTTSKIITETTSALMEVMHEHIKFPRTEAERNEIKQGFYRKYQFPGIIGAIDCTHVAIVAPSSEDPVRPGIAYYNRKGFYSINVQMICDSNLVITNCNARFPGSSHDSAIWSLSPIRQLLKHEFMNGANSGTWLIGDAGYPLQPWLLVPENYVDPNTPEGRYTQAHIRARNCIERCFGVLKQRFRCLLKHRVLHYHPVKAATIIYACAILHNIAIRNNIELPQDDDNQDGAIELPEEDRNNCVNNPVNNAIHQEGVRRRNVLKNTYFAN